MPIVEPRLSRQPRLGSRLRDEDSALVARTQAGDERAFAAIFKRHHAPLLSYCRHMLGNRDEGEDALQQAFIKAHQALLGGTEPRELRPWLYAIARNCCLSAIAARRATAPLEDHTPALAGLSEEVRQREDLRELLAALTHLPEDQRSALLLAELDDLSHEAIAKVVGCPVSKVKALVYQARSALIADRDARETPCQDIREQLSVARGGELRRGPLRRHLKLCSGCRDFQLAVHAQRQSLAALLPVLPSAGLAAAILGHGTAHAASAATIGGAGASAAPAGGAAGTSIGVTSTGATAASGSGVAVSGTAAASTAVGASAGASGGASVGAVVGGGLITKLAVGGTVVALAAAGAAAARQRAARASSTSGTAIPSRVAGAPLASFAARAREVANRTYISDDSPDAAPGTESPTALADASDPASSVATGPFTAPTDSGGSQPLLTIIGASSPSQALEGLPGIPATAAGQGSGGEGTTTPAAKANATLRHRALQIREERRARRRRVLRRARRRVRLRKARRKALVRRVHRVAPKAPKPLTPPVTAPPVRLHHRKARLTSPPPASPTASTTTGGESKASEGTKAVRHRPGAGTSGGGSGVPGTVSETRTTSTGAASAKGKAGSGIRGGSTGSGAGGAGSGAGGAGSGAGSAGSAPGSAGAGATPEKSSSTTGKQKAGSPAGAEKSKLNTEGEEASGAKGTTSETGASTAGDSGTGQKAESGDTASRTGGAAGATGTGAKRRESSLPQPKKQHLVEETQLPNL